MKNLISGMVLAVILCGLYATAQQPHVAQTLPSATVKLNGASGGGGSGTGFTYDVGEGAWIFTPPSGASDTRILSDGISLQDAAGTDIMAMDATLGATTYVAGRLAADAIEVRGSTSLAASGTITATNVTCSTGGGAVVGTLNATAGNVGRFVYVTRDGANTCTIGVASGQTLDGVTDGTTTVPSAGWKTFVQTTSTAWVTAGSYPVTGTLSGLTSTRIPVATSATAVGDSAITHDSTTGKTTLNGTTPLMSFRDYNGTASFAKIWWTGSTFYFANDAESGLVQATAQSVVSLDYVSASSNVTAGDTAAMVEDGSQPQFGLWLKNGAMVSWPYSATAAQAITYTGLQVSQSKALVDATATAFSRVAVASNSYEGGVLHYTVFATDATDYQNRSGSVPFAVRNLGGTETCTFGTASDAYDGTGTLTVTFDCAAGTDTVDLRATADTSLASTTIFTIQARVDLTSGLATVTPQ